MAEREAAIRAAAERYRLSEAAVGVLWEALARGGGRQAQFSHPELGGMGQWSGGMGQIGDMFDADLKARVGGACADLSAAMGAEAQPAGAGAWQRQSQGPAGPASPPPRASVPAAGAAAFVRDPPAARGIEPMRPLDFGPDWWPADFGRPAASGSQNGVRYAVFPDRRRLAIERDGQVALYDTGDHRIGGISQAQSRGSHLAFTSQEGAVDLDRLARVAR